MIIIRWHLHRLHLPLPHAGSASEITEYRRRFDKQDDPLFGEFVPQDFVADVNAVASVLKLYLRELPEPLLETSALPDLLTHMVASALFLSFSFSLKHTCFFSLSPCSLIMLCIVHRFTIDLKKK